MMRASDRAVWRATIAVLAPLFVLAIGCGPSDEELRLMMDGASATAIAAIPTVTPQPTATPQLTPTPQPSPTPQPAPTPRPTVTPQPTATPQLTPTPQSAATPQPTATPQPLSTPQPTATPAPTPTPQPLVDLNAVYLEARDSVFYIETPHGFGTGWLLESNQIVTAQHVVGPFATVTIRQAMNPAFFATVLATDSVRDIALLQFDPASAPLPVSARPLTLGQMSSSDAAEPLLALGYSGSGVKANGTMGFAGANVGVATQKSQSDQGDQLVMDVPVDPGDSGGPVLDQDGKVVGMSVAQQESTASGQRVVGTFFALHVDEIRSALPNLKAGTSR